MPIVCVSEGVPLRAKWAVTKPAQALASGDTDEAAGVMCRGPVCGRLHRNRGIMYGGGDHVSRIWG